MYPFRHHRKVKFNRWMDAMAIRFDENRTRNVRSVGRSFARSFVVIVVVGRAVVNFRIAIIISQKQFKLFLHTIIPANISYFHRNLILSFWIFLFVCVCLYVCVSRVNPFHAFSAHGNIQRPHHWHRRSNYLQSQMVAVRLARRTSHSTPSTLHRAPPLGSRNFSAFSGNRPIPKSSRPATN